MESSTKIRLLVHGGAGTVLKQDTFPTEIVNEGEKEMKRSLEEGYMVLKHGGSALDAVIAAVKILEDAPVMNAGKGAVFTTAGTNELDAGIVDGTSGLAGGVSTVTRIKNPICLARAVMDKTKHVLLCGQGAEDFARECGFTFVDPGYFWTERRWKQLEMVKSSGSRPQLDHNLPLQGTVGAVALDLQGNLASASSTGGMSGKMPGRVSDSSVVGAGFYANSQVAVSGTGDGDQFLRKNACRRIADSMEFGGKNVSEACSAVVHEDLAGNAAGIIGLDKNGKAAVSYNTPGMFRGCVDDNGEAWTATFLTRNF